MDLHNRYLGFPTTNILLLQTYLSESKSSVRHLIQSYSYEMSKEELDTDKLEFCRLLLCQEYQLVFLKTEKGKNRKCMLTNMRTADIEEHCLPSIKTIFPTNCSRSTSQISLLCDIMILQMILYCDISSVKQHLKDFLSSSDAYISTSNFRIMYMKILQYFLEFLCLYKFHAISVEESNKLEDLSQMYLEFIKSWLKLKEDSEWRLFALMFPKLVEVFTPSCIAFPLWDHLLCKVIDLKETLTGLSIMADVYFTPSDSKNYTHIYNNIYCSNTFWLFILRGLRLPLQQYRKQALYIMKKAVNSMSKNVILNFAHANLMKAQITPFICNKSDASIDHIKERFFMLYETLEEKQEHLITPVLSHVVALVKVNKEHRICDCFNVVWLQCIFEKILLHENNSIAKWGVSHVCELDDDTVFDDRFLELFVGVLNNNFFYECHIDEECPTIVKELSQFLRCAKKSNLLNRFLNKISCVAWGPVAIFYIIHALQTVSHEEPRSDWQANELNAIKSLVGINLSMHSHILRTASQIELLRAICNCVQRINDLPLFANVLAAFPPGESLTRGTPSWNVIKTWLHTVLKEKNAVIFVEETCTQYKKGNINPEMNPKTFATMIYLLYDASFLFLCKTCPAMEALNNLMYTLNGISMRPYADINSSINLAEFISHLLHLSVKGPHDKMTDFILSHVHTTFNFLIMIMKRISAQLTYKDYTRYTKIVSSHIINAPFFMSKKEVDNYAERLQSESLNLMSNLQNLNIQYLYGLHVLYLSQNIVVLPTLCKKHLLSMTNDIKATNLQGKIASEYHLLLLKLMHQYLINSPVSSWIPVTTMLTNLLKFLDVDSPENVSEIAKILTVMIDNKIISETSDRETLESIFNLGFTCINNGKKNNIFWMTIQNLMGVIINDNFLFLPNAVQFATGSIKQRPTCTISVASIVYHVAKLLSHDEQRIFICTALPYIAQCCLGQQFSARIYNQFILTELYDLMEKAFGDNSTIEYKGIYQAAVTGLLQQECPTKNSSKIRDDFYFSNFHPFEDYSLEMIYHELPRLTNVSCDEWISPTVFKDLMFKENNNHPLRHYNTNLFLTETKSSTYLTKSFTGDMHTKSIENNVETCIVDIQKKIDPSKPVNLSGDEMMNEFRFLQDTQLQEGLIVVASFVERPPNLGGIARTCEIFGIRALVVTNANCVKDKEFQFLSVSADKWLNILQVKPHELQKFLLDKKEADWSLIGVEQTINSVNLMTMTFEKRTILVLGNEKDGIPANFIPLFDKCVQIPQVGVTRSLNVHVTAAICIWQYANQHILK
ncbi:uncharacterized protein LOC105836856 isoform X2 [Monomorium pharaonis]|uniref:uncharacterized protein LOC105836856 isoform X2 n=1 Tax=Monomorium pharaonis TaxID=307658 RepID=UPI0017467A61|nr:uncharacterized protein LOC105836856 isoform X2 [Monomorium pharaonis]